jgi:hypothetical protein
MELGESLILVLLLLLLLEGEDGNDGGDGGDGNNVGESVCMFDLMLTLLTLGVLLGNKLRVSLTNCSPVLYLVVVLVLVLLPLS